MLLVPPQDWQGHLTALLQADPGRRGLAGLPAAAAPGARLGLVEAAADIVQRGRSIGIVTGFPIAGPKGVAAETDGPLGALYLARACLALGGQVDFVCDPLVRPAIEIGVQCYGLTGARIRPFDALRSGEDWGWTHLISIERPGPTHTLESFVRQPRAEAPPVADFEAELPPDQWGQCRNMRGAAIDDLAEPLWILFETARTVSPALVTLGLIDGGNEIGAGSIPWEVLRQRVAGGGRIACRVPTDFTLVAGVSNWAAYGLSLAMAILGQALDAADAWTARAHGALLTELVGRAGLVDGLSGQRVPRVDGLDTTEYLGHLENLRAACGLANK
jgi:hypothetical protein